MTADELDRLSKALGLTIPCDLHPFLVKDLADLRRMTELLRMPRSRSGDGV